MSGKGLDETGRDHVAALINKGASADRVKTAIDTHVRSNNWDYDKNLRFLDWMRQKGWSRAADHLARYIER